MQISGVSLDQAKQVIGDFASIYPYFLNVKFLLVEKQEDAYGPQATIANVGRIKGGYYPFQRATLFVVSNLRDESDLRDTLKHELLGHCASYTFTEPDKRRLLQVIANSRDSPSLANDWRRIDKDYSGKSDMVKAEEMLCLAAERVGLPHEHDLASQKDARAAWRDCVSTAVRPLEQADLQKIVNQVAYEVHKDMREQKIFPVNDMSQFRCVAQDQRMQQLKTRMQNQPTTTKGHKLTRGI